MNWNISAWCIRHPIPPIVLFLLLTIAGVTSFFALGVEDQPNTDAPWVTVFVADNGAAPMELESQVTRTVEDAVAGVAGVKHINSNVQFGYSNTFIEFELGSSPDRAMNEVREAIAGIRAQLPASVNEPQIQLGENDSGDWIGYTIASGKRSPMELSWLVDNDVTRALMATGTVAHVYREGGVYRQINVHLDPVRLEAYGVTADMVNTQLRALNVNLPGGKGSVASAEESIRTLGSAHSLESLKETRIALPNHRWVELRALGSVVDGVGEVRSQARLNGQPVIAFDMNRKRGKSIVDVEKQVDAALTDLHKRLPDVTFKQIYSDAKHVKESCSATFESLALGALLAVFVIFMFLRDYRAALIAAVAMPLSVIPTFAFMGGAGFTLNSMSLLALALAIGILVDDAIVEIENIVRHMNLGKRAYKASIDAADEIGLAVVATTMAAVVVFLPVAFMGGVSGLKFRQFGLTVSVAVFCSLIVARMITPLMAAYWLKNGKREEKESMFAPLYQRTLLLAMRHRVITVLVGLIFFGASLALFKAMPTSLVARIDKSESRINIELPPGSQLDETSQVLDRVVKAIQARPEVESVYDRIGGGQNVNSGYVEITLKPKDQRKLSQDQFEAALRPELEKIPGAHITFGGGWGSGAVQIMLTGYDSASLTDTAAKLVREMHGIPQLTDIRSDLDASSPEIVVVPDTAKAADQGVSVQAIARTALIATMGDNYANMPKFDTADRQIPIVVQLDPKYRHDMSVIRNMKVIGNDGRLVPLQTVASLSLDSGLSQINRYDRARKVYIRAKFGADYTLGEALKAIHSLPAFKDRPSSVKDNLTGDAEMQEDMFGGFGYAIFTGVLLIYAVLCLLFRGFLQPLTIMMSLPLSLGGALIGLWLFHKPIETYALIGIVMLMGLVTKNAILLVEYCLSAMDQGMSRTRAILTAGRTRMRPILMTTTAMIAGMIPIATGIGAGAEARAAMAIAVVGGLFMSTILTLVVVPVVFTYMHDLQEWIKQTFAGGAAAHDDDDDRIALAARIADGGKRLDYAETDENAVSGRNR